ncbi:membrane frizzled-related protein-like [Branchiostoma floridae x Branchiostoma belcheri]
MGAVHVIAEFLFFLRLVVCLGFFGGILGQQVDPCGTGRPLVMQGYTGTFSSPNYPQNYPAKRTCSWRVKSDARGRQLWLVFDDRFSIEHYKKCEYDYLKIYDGPDENAPLVKTLCDEEAPQPVNLTGNDAFVKFKSDQAITKTGFRITWRTCPPNMLLCDVGSVCLRPENRCDMTQHCQDWTDELNCVYGQQNACGGQVLADGPGNITTLNYPVFFPPGLSCTWNIVAAPGKRLRARFTGIFDVPCLTAVKVREMGPTRNKPNNANGISTFCGRRTPSDIIVTMKERLRVHFQPPMVIPGKGFALTWETSCQENYFSCPEGSCIVPEKVCDGANDCQQGEDESYPACPTTAPPTSTPIVTTGNDGKPESETALTSNTLASNTLASNTLASNTLASNTVTPGKWSTDYHTASQTGPIREKTIPSATSTTQHGLIHTSTVREGIYKASSATPHAWTNMTVTWAWNGTLGGSTSLTTQSLDTYPSRQCYSCHDDGACASPLDSAVPVTECLDDQACWVERILGPGKQKERIVYRRGCGSLCPEYWEQEDCMDGWVQTCRLCCAEDLCNSQLLNGDDKRFSNQVSESGMAEAPEPNWIHLLVAALSAVGIFTA